MEINNIVNPRYFNTIEINKSEEKLRKTSQNISKLKYEILWYLNIPKEINYLAPTILGYSLDCKNMYIDMKYYPYHTVHDLLINYKLNEIQWQKVHDLIFMAINDMKRYSVDIDKKIIEKTLIEMYYKKTIDRLNNLKNNINFKKYFNNNININGKEYKGLNFYIDNLYEILEKNKIFKIDKLNIIHGDLCFSNILCDTKGDTIKLIDPRGKFGEFNIYGDYRYDLAKLSHSVSGKYDYIINDLFELEENGNGIFLKILDTENREVCKNIFYKYIPKEIIYQIDIIEALLFLSMIPLHKDYHKRQLAMMCVGIMVIDNYFK